MSDRGGTPISEWTPADPTACGGVQQGHLYNTQIAPFTVGPMALAGLTWYQGEEDTHDEATARSYACVFPSLIKGWRANFHAPNLYFSFVQLSTWCAIPAMALAEMRDAQMAALSLTNVAYATNADHGDGCAIHPKNKRPVGERLGNTALALVYNRSVAWKSPSYASQTALSVGSETKVTVALVDATVLEERPPSNARYANASVCAAENAKVPFTCAWAAVELRGLGWLNASVAVNASNLVLTVPAVGIVMGSAYGWGAIPMLTVYDHSSSLPVLPWNTSYIRGSWY